MMEDTILIGKLADNYAQTRVLDDKVKFLKDIGASMAALLSSGPDYQDMTPQDYQDNMKTMADLFNLLSSRSLEADNPATVAAASTSDRRKPNKSVSTKAPACVAFSHDVAAATLIPPPQVTHYPIRNTTIQNG